jgi:NO-binding membrane sensor protein with MHYT domain
MDTALLVVGEVAAAAVCLAGCLRGFAAFPLEGPQAGQAARTTAAMLIGVSVWAEPLLSDPWPASVRLAPGLLVASLAVAIAASAWALFCRDRSEGAQRIIGPAGILGGGMALCNGVDLIAMRGPIDLGFDDTPFCTGILISSALSAGAFLALGALRGRRRLLASAICVALGDAAATALSRAAMQVGQLSGPLDAGAAPQWAATLSALAVVAVMATGLSVLTAPPRATPATRARASHGSRRPSRWRTPVGTGFLRPAPVRSVAARAAGPGRRAPPAS